MADINISQLKKRGGLYENLPAGTAADNVFVVTTPDGPVGRIKKGIVNCEEAGIFANGSDMTAAINAAYALAKIKAIEFHIDGGGEITITGTVTIPAGKVMKFRSGTMLKTTGSGVVNGGIIEAGDNAQIFSGTKNVNPTGCSKPYSSVNWYGANNGTDENGACINIAVQVVIKNNSMPRRLVLPDRNYTITSTGILLINLAGTYNQVSIELYGNDISALSVQSTTLTFTNPNTFGICMQVGKGVSIRGLKIQGPFVRTWGNMKAFVEVKLADYSTGSGCRDTVYSPCCGINIDPFCGVVPPDGGYPGLTSYYTGGVTVEGSTMPKIEHCTVTGWVVGLGVSINGTTLNADSGIVHNCCFENNKVNFAWGQDQTKGWVLTKILTTAFTHTVSTNIQYGSKTGAPPNIRSYTIAGQVNQIFDYDTAGRFGFEATDIYAESTYRIGKIIGKPAKIINMIFNAMLAEYPGVLGAPDLCLYGGNVTFVGGMFRHYDNLYTKRLSMAATNCTFIGVNFDKPPLIQDFGQNQFVNCSCDSGHAISSGDFSVDTDYDITNYLQHGRIRVDVKQNFGFGQANTEYNFKRDYEGRVLAGNGLVLTVNATNRTATFPTGNDLYNAQVNDYIIKETPGAFFDNAGTMPFEVVGRITSIGGGTTTLADVPVEIVSGTYNLYTSFFKTIGIPFIGDITNGSPTITNVESSQYGFPYVGMRLSAFDFGFIPNVYVTAVNPGLKTVTMSTGAFTTARNIEFNNYGRTIIFAAQDPAYGGYVNAKSIFYTGTIFQGYARDDDNVVYPRKWECIKPGYIKASSFSALHQSVWKYEHTDVFRFTGNNTRNIEGGAGVEKITLLPTANMTVSIGTTPGGTDVADALDLVSGVSTVLISPLASDAGITFYFTGITAAVDIKIFKKSL
jgi:hypothetical protein